MQTAERCERSGDELEVMMRMELRHQEAVVDAGMRTEGFFLYPVLTKRRSRMQRSSPDPPTPPTHSWTEVTKKAFLCSHFSLLPMLHFYTNDTDPAVLVRLCHTNVLDIFYFVLLKLYV